MMCSFPDYFLNDINTVTKKFLKKLNLSLRRCGGCSQDPRVGSDEEEDGRLSVCLRLLGWGSGAGETGVDHIGVYFRPEELAQISLEEGSPRVRGQPSLRALDRE